MSRYLSALYIVIIVTIYVTYNIAKDSNYSGDDACKGQAYNKYIFIYILCNTLVICSVIIIIIIAKDGNYSGGGECQRKCWLYLVIFFVIYLRSVIYIIIVIYIARDGNYLGGGECERTGLSSPSVTMAASASCAWCQCAYNMALISTFCYRKT